ncbi:uncharacterized protein LOC128191386 [Crassostrea angulata]|uniref:uncharacterized protein LOC128191386 n=1 Tax=Magallana angulata TaxID=2784310 RepID=UPI0022B0F6A7|nr:uncharacterized protein LOC128191386 [Crassostrea angulata]
MALSKPDNPDIVQDESIIAQHYLVCGTEDCEENCQFYCNDCHQPKCEQCKNEHQKNPDTKNHEMVPYQQRKIQLPVQKCKDHPTKNIDMICEDCQAPVCSKCVLQNHQKHALNDLETIYSEKITPCLEKIHKIRQYFIPNSLHMQRDIKKNAEDIKKIMDDLKRSMKTETESLKCLLETVLSDNLEQVNKMEESIMKELQSQDKTFEDYISYLGDLLKKFNGYLSSTELQNYPIIFSISDHLNIRPIPETTKAVPPIFTAGQYNKEDVTKLLGKVTVPEPKPENSKIKPTETAATQYILKYLIYLFIFLSLFFLLICCIAINNHLEKPTLSLSSPVIIVRKYKVPDVKGVCHISLGKSGRLWVSDNQGNLVQTDQKGNLLKRLQTTGGYGYHTVTQDGVLIYTNKDDNVINRIAPDNTITEFIKTGDWEPISVHSSRINGDILVGMVKDGVEAKVTRYDKSGTEIQNIQWDNKGQALYSDPHYITENINGDVCVSDYEKQAVVVVGKSGQHRFSYTLQMSEFLPYGIETDIMGHILVCNADKVYFLDQGGHALFSLLIKDHHKDISLLPLSVCVDEENNLHVGSESVTTVRVHKYLQ